MGERDEERGGGGSMRISERKWKEREKEIDREREKEEYKCDEWAGGG